MVYLIRNKRTADLIAQFEDLSLVASVDDEPQEVLAAV